MTRIIIRPAAEREIDDARRYYEEEAELGADFLDEIDRSLEGLLVIQHRFPEVRPGVRRTIVRRFPYAIYFKMVNLDVHVLAVLHVRRSPKLVAARTKS